MACSQSLLSLFPVFLKGIHTVKLIWIILKRFLKCFQCTQKKESIMWNPCYLKDILNRTIQTAMVFIIQTVILSRGPSKASNPCQVYTWHAHGSNLCTQTCISNAGTYPCIPRAAQAGKRQKPCHIKCTACTQQLSQQIFKHLEEVTYFPQFTSLILKWIKM